MKKLFMIIFLISTTSHAQQDEAPVQDSQARKMKVGVFYNSADTAKLKESRLTTSTGSLDLKLESTLGLSLDYVFVDKSSKWDWSVGATYDLAKKMKKSSLTLGGSDYSLTPNGSPKIAILSLNGNAIYKVDDRISIPMGINISRPLLSGESDEAKVAGGIGYQAGIEYSLDPKSIIEIQYRATYLTGQQKDGSDILEYGKGFLAGFQLGYKYAF